MGVPGMGSGRAGPWVTGPSLGASHFGVTQGPAQLLWSARFLGRHHMGALGNTVTLPSRILDFLLSLFLSFPYFPLLLRA